MILAGLGKPRDIDGAFLELRNLVGQLAVREIELKAPLVLPVGGAQATRQQRVPPLHVVEADVFVVKNKKVIGFRIGNSSSGFGRVAADLVVCFLDRVRSSAGSGKSADTISYPRPGMAVIPAR
jgi:hypothetical protein